jgi:hypothetical protein
LEINWPGAALEHIDMNRWRFIALMLLTLQASSASALTRSDCEKDYETCLGSNACKAMSRARGGANIFT